MASYARGRRARYRLAGGLCEACGVELKGHLHPDGVAWECDHHQEARLFWLAGDLEAANAVENLRCYCKRDHLLKKSSESG